MSRSGRRRRSWGGSGGSSRRLGDGVATDFGVFLTHLELTELRTVLSTFDVVVVDSFASKSLVANFAMDLDGRGFLLLFLLVLTGVLMAMVGWGVTRESRG